MKKGLVLLLMLVMTVSFAGCGSSGGGSDAGEEVIFRIGSSTGFDTFNALTTNSMEVYEWLNLCYDSLIAFDDDYNAVPRAAEKWTVSEDGLTWTFYLRDDIKFNDGEPLTSADVKYTYEVAVDSYMYSMHAMGFSSIECPDDYTVVFNCEEPKADMLYQIIPILPEHIWSQQEDVLTFEPETLVGSGPFIYSPERSGNGSKTFVKNTEYWGRQPSIDALVFTEYDNNDAMAQALKIGEIDACNRLEKTQMDTLQGEEGIEVGAYTAFGFEFLAYNLLDPITADKTVRYAIDYCFDKELAVEMSYGGLAVPAYGSISNEGFQYVPSEKRDLDIDKANELLDEAGYLDTDGDGIREMNGTPLSIELTTASERTSWQSATVDMMITNCAKAGIEITWNPIEKTVMWDTCCDGNPDWQLFIEGWGGEVDPGSIMCIYLDYEDGDGCAGVSYQNPEFDELYYAQSAAIDKDERLELLNEAQELIYEDCPYTFICYDQIVQAVNGSKWTGFSANSNGFFLNEKIDNYLNIKPAA